MGGTVPSINPPNTAPGDAAPLDFRRDRGDATGAGGVCDLTCGDSTTVAGGVGTFCVGMFAGVWEWGETPDSSSVLVFVALRIVEVYPYQSLWALDQA
jgi:hypothetical protein